MIRPLIVTIFGGGHYRWPKHVEGYAVHNTTQLHICICTCWLYFP